MKAKTNAVPTKRKSKSAKRTLKPRRTATRSVPVAPRAKPARARSSRKRIVTRRPRAGRRTAIRKRSPALPPILFEGDHPAPPPLSGPGEKFALGSQVEPQVVATAELPESYGTGRLFVTTRDPHWLYAHWDLTREQQRRCNARSVHGHLVLRTYLGAVAGKPVAEMHVHPESRHWFAHVERAAAEYVAELGYYGRERRWTRVATSAPTVTPPDTISADADVSLATIPMDATFEELEAKAGQAGGEALPLAQAWEAFRRLHEPVAAVAVEEEVSRWTPEQERALAEAIRMDLSPCAWMDSLAIAELIQGGLAPGVFTSAAEEAGVAVFPSIGEYVVSSPSEGFGPGAKGFWFNVNAELVVYGATAPDAAVSIDGQRIALRPDGSFSYRFALPDGQYALNVTAVSADDTDGRAVGLRFQRATEFVGDVGEHPHEPGLLPPAPADA